VHLVKSDPFIDVINCFIVLRFVHFVK
jgi:hypothetical protein